MVSWSAAEIESFLRSQFALQTAHYRTHYPGASYLLICDGDEPIGRFYVDRSLEDIHVLDITLVPERRGQGIGSGILGDLLTEASASGKKVSLYVEKFNPARRLYARMGLRQVRDEGVYWLLESGGADSGAAQPPAPGESGGSAD